MVTQGTEDLSALSTMSPKPVMGLLDVPPGVSRIHACRRLFQHLSDTNNDLSIIHLASFPGAAEVCPPQILLQPRQDIVTCLCVE